MKTLKEIYKNHSGKVSDKWNIYLDTYEEKLSSLKKSPVKLFEIGVLNGGSLEIFSKYFENAELILGCDIDKNCQKLKYTENNIKLVVGDVNNEKISSQIIKNGDFDIIIDDGSHTSKDIVTSFCKYFKHLKYNGTYIVEDLHASYQKEHGGGLFYPISSMNFFKKLVDIINFEHWGVNKDKGFILRTFKQNYQINMDGVNFDEIHSIEFINSLCFIKKKLPKENELGKRHVVGNDALVVPDRKKYHDTEVQILDQKNNPWSNTETLPEEELAILKKK